MIPAALIGMLAVNRLGAIHATVFGGFAPTALAQRIEACTLYYHNPSQERHYKYMYLTTLMAIQCCYRYTVKYLYAFMPVKPNPR